RLVRPRAWMSEGVGISGMNPESYRTGRPGLARRHAPDVQGHDPAGHRLPGDVLQAGLAHDLGDPVRAGIALDAADEVPVGAALSGHPADDGHDLVEPELQDAREAAARPGDLEAD